MSVIPATEPSNSFDRLRYFWDFKLFGSPSKFCIGDKLQHMPWIYPPIQVYLYLGITALSAWCSILIGRSWQRGRQ